MSPGHFWTCHHCGRLGFWRTAWGGWPRYEHSEPPYYCWFVADELRADDPDGLNEPGARRMAVPAATQLELL